MPSLRSSAVFFVFGACGVGPALFLACGGSDTTATQVTDDGGSGGADVETADRGQIVTADGGDTDSGKEASTDAQVPCTLGDGGTGLQCGSTCVDIASDPLHCGSCTKACDPGSICQSGCVNVAGSLSGLRWELPCTADGPQAEVCITNAVQTQTATLQGTSGQSYDVTLHFRGIVEQKTYNGSAPPDAGLADGGSNPGFYVVGGSPNADDWNVYQLSVSDPPYTAYLNNGASGHYYVDGLDYAVTVRMKAGATVTLTANPEDNGPYEIRNRDNVDGGAIVVPGVSPAPAPFNGQFVQMDVTGVTVAP